MRAAARDLRGALSTLETLENGPRTLAAATDATLLRLEIAIELGDVERVGQLIAGAVNAIGYWGHKLTIGRIGDEEMSEVITTAVHACAAVAHFHARRGVHDQANGALDLAIDLATQTGANNVVEQLTTLRAQLGLNNPKKPSP
jgi:hypothetical protein